jgi:hypothetical protein
LITGGCDAFPEGIIDEVLLTNIHNDVYPQQSNEILFEEGEPKFE